MKRCPGKRCPCSVRPRRSIIIKIPIASNWQIKLIVSYMWITFINASCNVAKFKTWLKKHLWVLAVLGLVLLGPKTGMWNFTIYPTVNACCRMALLFCVQSLPLPLLCPGQLPLLPSPCPGLGFWRELKIFQHQKQVILDHTKKSNSYKGFPAKMQSVSNQSIFGWLVRSNILPLWKLWKI